MHVYFSGIGGTGIGPLALIAHQAGLRVSGSDKQDNLYIKYLRTKGITDIHIGQAYDDIAAVHARQSIDWFVYTSALPMEQPNAPELRFCRDHAIKHSKRDEFLNDFLHQKNLQLIAIAGTHGKTTTTAMAVWLCKQVGIPISYAVGTKLSFGEMGEFDPASRYFIYEADEFDRNFLAFRPHLSLITGLDWDHPDIYPTRQEYNDAFRQFLGQSTQTMMWQSDAALLGCTPSNTKGLTCIDEQDTAIEQLITLPGRVNRLDAWLVAHGIHAEMNLPLGELYTKLNRFPGLSRRFEQIVPGLYSDYAHTAPKIRGALQVAHEQAGANVVVVYEGLHNTRQHFMKNDLEHLFDAVKQLYIVPSYLAREDPNLPLLSPADLKKLLSDQAQAHTKSAQLDDQLRATMQQHIDAGDLVLAITAGGGGSLDEWLRQQF